MNIGQLLSANYTVNQAVQQLDYAAFARNETTVRAREECRQVTTAGAANSPCADVIAVAAAILRTNLRDVRGLRGGADAIEPLVRSTAWTVLPNGGNCTVHGTPVHSPPGTPLICAEMLPTMVGIVGWGEFRPRIIAADVLDQGL
ncbi:hypothetical protein [Candidatus Viridilinea mediisalina]|uniref:Uncharacterized protein n=1 Tax=Candidatus Viridilinea mediisalina TaxID=2024553 RepID=A0A2A6RHF6_9CHLR|nr:hypothetical protein [Candidatus Viridilinea mediisalina]PDW02280.1 hypothetical protein CJ255_14720 [Candidatus Viridilinea mediisalina]